MLKSLALSTSMIMLASSAALADQCIYVSRDVALKAVPFFQKAGGVAQSYCPTCGHGPQMASKFTFTTVTAGPIKDDPDYWGLYLDGDPVDLAYVYIHVGSSKDWTNAGALANCNFIEAPPRTLPTSVIVDGD